MTDEKRQAETTFPGGEISENGEGAINLGFTTTGKRVVIDFGKKIAWLTFDEEGAREFGQRMIELAASLKAQRLAGL
jgi:hypothetical protein